MPKISFIQHSGATDVVDAHPGQVIRGRVLRIPAGQA